MGKGSNMYARRPIRVIAVIEARDDNGQTSPHRSWRQIRCWTGEVREKKGSRIIFRFLIWSTGFSMWCHILK